MFLGVLWYEVFAGDKEILIMKTIAASELRRAPYILLTILIILAAGITAAGYLYYQHYKDITGLR